MNTTKLRSKRIIIPTVAAVALLGVGGVVWASTAAGDDLKGDELDRASQAAVEAAGGGRVTGAEKDDDAGVVVYEVEVTREDGTEVDVDLDENYDVVSQDDDRDDRDDDRYDDDRDGDDRYDDDNGNGSSTGGNGTDGTDGIDADDRPLTAEERTNAERAALAAVPGTVTDAERSDDRGEAFEVEVLTADGVEWTVELDDAFEVVGQQRD